MIYRVTADLMFTSQDEARDFYHDCELALAKAATINPGQDTEEKGIIILHQCYHDAEPVNDAVPLASAQTP